MRKFLFFFANISMIFKNARSVQYSRTPGLVLSIPITGNPSSKYEHRRASALMRNIQNIRICMGKKTYLFCNLRKWKDFNKKQLTLLKMCVTSLLCVARADLWPFYGFLCKRFSLYIKFYQGWALQRSGSTDPPKENGRKFAPTAPIASKFRLGNTR